MSSVRISRQTHFPPQKHPSTPTAQNLYIIPPHVPCVIPQNIVQAVCRWCWGQLAVVSFVRNCLGRSVSCSWVKTQLEPIRIRNRRRWNVESQRNFFSHCEKKYENRVKYKGVKKLLVWFWLWAALEVKMSECYWQGWILQMQWIAWFVRLDWQIFWCNTFSRVIEHNQCDFIKIAISSELQNNQIFKFVNAFD